MLLDNGAIRNAASDVASQMIGRPLKGGEALISSGLIDSLSILKLISHLETKLGISIPTDTVQPDDFDNVERIVETVGRVARA